MPNALLRIKIWSILEKNRKTEKSKLNFSRSASFTCKLDTA